MWLYLSFCGDVNHPTSFLKFLFYDLYMKTTHLLDTTREIFYFTSFSQCPCSFPQFSVFQVEITAFRLSSVNRFVQLGILGLLQI